MNHRAAPHPSTAGRKALTCLSLLLLIAATPQGVQALPRRPVLTFVDRAVDAAPYLPINGAPPLRFSAGPAKPKTELPPLSATRPSDAADAVATGGNRASAAANGVSSTGLIDALTGGEATNDSKEAKSTTAKSPAPILSDEVRPMVRPEDFLPYFQIPATARNSKDVTLFVPAIPMPPAPGTLPASSATYTQSPK